MRLVDRTSLVSWMVFVACVLIHSILKGFWFLVVGSVGILLSMTISLTARHSMGTGSMPGRMPR